MTFKSKYLGSQDGKFFHTHQLDFDKPNEFKLNTMHIEFITPRFCLAFLA